MAQFTDLVDGYRRFRETGWAAQKDRWTDLKDGQNPRILIIACSDSRVDPAQIFDTRPGEVFVVRNVAALVPPFDTSGGLHGISAAIEYAVNVLNVEEIVVMGHGLCGGCKAALHETMRDAPPGDGGFIAAWISMLASARSDVAARYASLDCRDAERAMEQAAVLISLNHLRTFPEIARREAIGAMSLVGAFFAISDGVLHVLDEKSGVFFPA